jgi:PAS domain-containing protein
MELSQEAASHPILDELHDALRHVLTVLEQKWEEATLILRSVSPSSRMRGRRSFRVQSSDGMDVGVRFGVYPMGDGTNEVYVEVENGPTRRFTYDPGNLEADTEKARLGRTVTSMLLSELEPHLGQGPVAASAPDAVPPTPRLVLDEEGRITSFNDAARRVLDCPADESYDPNFFAHVHGRNLRRVMRDLARMVRHDLRRARWLLRLETGTNRWRWFRVKVLNRLIADGVIQLHLHPVGQGQVHA